MLASMHPEKLIRVNWFIFVTAISPVVAFFAINFCLSGSFCYDSYEPLSIWIRIVKRKVSL